MFKDMFYKDLTEEELQQVTGGDSPYYFLGGISGATYGTSNFVSTSLQGGLTYGNLSAANTNGFGYLVGSGLGYHGTTPTGTFASQYYGNPSGFPTLTF